ncbi:Protein of unknown function [Bacillus toyonensis]|nr:Protein of unknown function [Bacillus toyonensis]
MRIHTVIIKYHSEDQVWLG